MAAGIVGDGKGLDPAIVFGLFCKIQDLFQPFPSCTAARYQLKGDGKFPAIG